MCRRAHCYTCGNLTWAGCGQHVNQVMAGVPQKDRCTCDEVDRNTSRAAALFARLFGRT